MGHFQIDHRAHRAQDACEIFRLVVHELRLEQVGRAESKVERVLEHGDEAGHDGEMGVELDLAWKASRASRQAGKHQCRSNSKARNAIKEKDNAPGQSMII